MKREFMSNLPLEVIVNDENGSHRVDDDETILCIRVSDFIRWLHSDAEFYQNPTQATMNKVLNAYVRDQIDTLKEEAGWYIQHAMPLFLEKDLKKKGKGEMIACTNQ